MKALCCKMFLLILIVILFCEVSTEAKNGIFYLAEGPLTGKELEDAYAEIVCFEKLTHDYSWGKPIEKAFLTGECFVIWINEDIELINVYNLAGEFLYGYRIGFSVTSSTYDVFYDVDDQCICLCYTRKGDRIYKISSDAKIRYVYTIDPNVLYDPDTYKRTSRHSILSYDNARIVIKTADGEEIVPYDHSEEYMKNMKKMREETERQARIMMVILPIYFVLAVLAAWKMMRNYYDK